MLVKYFSKFPLLGQNYQGYEKWYKVLSNKNNTVKTNISNKTTKTEITLFQTASHFEKIDNKINNLSNLSLSKKRNFSTLNNLTGLSHKLKSNISLEDSINFSGEGEETIDLNPFFVTGFVDAEGCFLINVRKNNKYKLGLRVEPSFQITLHKKDKDLLEKIQNFFSVGSICEKKQSITYHVYSTRKLALIIKHFEKYPLITQKQADFLLFNKAVNLINNKEHLTLKGLQQIISLKASVNRGLTSEIIEAFPNVIPVDRPDILNCQIQDPN